MIALETSMESSILASFDGRDADGELGELGMGDCEKSEPGGAWGRDEVGRVRRIDGAAVLRRLTSCLVV